jgi:hypothetical protein
VFFLADPILVSGLSLLKPALRLMTSYRLLLESKKRLLDYLDKPSKFSVDYLLAFACFLTVTRKPKLCTFR